MDAQEVLKLKKQVEEDFKKDTEAIDRVLALLERNKSNEKPHTPDLRESPSEVLPPETVLPTATKFDFAEDEVTGADSASGNPSGNKFGRVRDSGVRGIAKQTVPFLGEFFTRKELVETIAKHFPEWKDKLTRDAMSGAVERLKEDKLIEVHTTARGKEPAIWRKL